MIDVLLFALLLQGAALLSSIAERSMLSVPVIALAAGFAAGPHGLGWLQWTPQTPGLKPMATGALIAVLFTDGMHLAWSDLRAAWRLPGRALLLGLPLTLLLIAGLAHALLGLAWLPGLLLAAVLTPTDPVFASAIVERRDVAQPLRRLLNIESGLNDGLALPIVLVLIARLGPQHEAPTRLLAEVLGGVALGVVLPWAALRLPRQLGGLQVPEGRQPVYLLSIGAMVFAAASLLHVNEYLASFFAGVSVASAAPRLRDRYQALGEQVGTVLKLGALLVFGAMLSWSQLRSLSWADWAFAALTLLVARPVGLLLSVLGSGLGWKQRLAAAWFGPKGFASLIYAVLVLDAGLVDGERLFRLALVVTALSIVAHSSTGVPMARWLKRDGEPRQA